MDETRIISVMTCQECGGQFEPRRAHGRFCTGYCRVKWNRRNSRGPAEAPADSRAAAVELARLTGARQAGQITAGQFAAASVGLIGRFASVHDALIALGTLAWEGMERAAAAPDREHEDA